MNLQQVADKAQLEPFFRRDALRNVYCLGDLDDYFWPHTTWHGLLDGGELVAVALLYTGSSLPTLLCMGPAGEQPQLELLLRSLLPSLPARFYCHVNCGLDEVLRERFSVESHGRHHKMGLTDPTRLPREDRPDIAVLSPAELADIQAFYARSYPGNWFEPAMLATGQYLGLRVDGRLVSAAGVHVFSPTYRVAALGNITTDPACRGRGYAKTVPGQLCRRLLQTVDHIGLNVKADNAAASACYRRLGFEVLADYEELMAELAGEPRNG